MPLNMTQIAGMTQDQAILEFHKSLTTPSLIILYLATIITLIITTLATYHFKSKLTFIITTLVITIIMSTAFLIFLTVLPGLTQNIMNWFS